MARIIAAVALFVSLMLVPFAIASNASSASPAPDALPTITITLPPVTVSLPPVTLPPVTIRATQTVQVPGPVVTQFLSGPTRTVTVHSTQTATAQSTQTLPGGTHTKRINATATVTKTVKSLPHRQHTKTHDTLGNDHPSGLLPNISFGGTVQKAALGTVAIFALVGLLLLGMYLGYYLGYKDADKNEAKFLRALLRR